MPDMYEPIPGIPQFGRLAPLLTTPLPLFEQGNANALKVVQKRVTNCPLPALLAAMAHAMPGRLHAMIEMRSLRVPRSSYFFDSQPEQREPSTFIVREILSVAFQHQTIEISPFLYLEHDRPGKIIPRFGSSTDGGGWVSYIEKAYVGYRCKYRYSNLNFLGGSATPLTVARVVEDVAHDFDWFRLTERELWQNPDPLSPDPPPGGEDQEIFLVPDARRMITAYRSTRGVTRELGAILGNHGTRATIATTPAPHNHTLAVIGYDGASGEVTLYDALRNAPLSPMTLQTFVESHDAVYQVR